MSSQVICTILSAALRAAGGHIPEQSSGPLFRPSTRYPSPITDHRSPIYFSHAAETVQIELEVLKAGF